MGRRIDTKQPLQSAISYEVQGFTYFPQPMATDGAQTVGNAPQPIQNTYRTGFSLLVVQLLAKVRVFPPRG